MQQAVMYVRELSVYLGLSETAIRAHLCRKNYCAVPKPIYLGHRIAWRKEDVDQWLYYKTKEEQKRKGGRS